MIFATQDQINDYENASQRPGYTLVYGLCCPHTKEVRYIGVTGVDPRRRFNSHTCEARNGKKTHKCNWMRQVLLETGSWPLPAILDVVKDEDREEAERGLIEENRERLVNGTDGGEGILGLKHSEETKKKISRAKKGRKLPKELVERQAALRRGTKRSEETKSRMREAQKERFKRGVSEETKRKMSEAQKRRRKANLG